MTPRWNAAVVVHRPELAKLEAVLASAETSPSFAEGLVVDNSERPDPAAAALVARHRRWTYRVNPRGNAGFGQAHNWAFQQLPAAEFHAVLNPDVAFGPEAIEALSQAMQADPELVLAAPALFHPDGTRQYLTKRYPSLRALFGRRFAGPLYRLLGFDRDDAFFTMRDQDYNQPMEPEFVSGAFMFFRHAAFARLGGFDERFFLYLEDCDLTLRARAIGRVAYVPEARVIHHWARGNHRSLKLTLEAIRSAIYLFNKHGWRWRDPRLPPR
ncbi:MAG: glycosyltransferase [Casimicrobiaceae bacterium]|nr:glycosyltransferase [Casimicrobiaceae bacterium]MCX8097398.1 glycosyltransferase [Casimicrobiaceae bacterium]MDW8312031.1 glycosyltransferase [Burkholderiales bacterium]